jgi:hypothetical protein
MFRAYKFLNLHRNPSLKNQTSLSTEKAYNYILNFSKKTFFKKTTTLSIAAGKKDFYSK